jgi:hypothetical protein
MITYWAPLEMLLYYKIYMSIIVQNPDAHYLFFGKGIGQLCPFCFVHFKAWISVVVFEAWILFCCCLKAWILLWCCLEGWISVVVVVIFEAWILFCYFLFFFFFFFFFFFLKAWILTLLLFGSLNPSIPATTFPNRETLIELDLQQQNAHQILCASPAVFESSVQVLSLHY